MNVYIRRGFGDPNIGYEYYLEDEDGNLIDSHFSSNDGWAKEDLLHDKPEYENAEVIFIKDIWNILIIIKL